MVRVLDNIMSDQKALPPQAQENIAQAAITLPSYGMSEYMDVANVEAVNRLLSKIRQDTAQGQQQNGAVPSRSMDPSDNKAKGMSSASSEEDIHEADVPMETGISHDTQMADLQQIYNYFHFTAGSTQPLGASPSTSVGGATMQGSGPSSSGGGVTMQIPAPSSSVGGINILGPGSSTSGMGATSTIDAAQLLALVNNGVIKEDTVKKEEPEMILKTSDYVRFRYESERTCKTKKPRQYEMDEDRRCVAEVTVKNYEGAALIIAYCVNALGNLHPFSLFGEHCDKGVYVNTTHFGSRSPTFKLTKVIISTPKKKEYKNRLADIAGHLKSQGVLERQQQGSTDLGDMQVVYLMVKVKLLEADYVTDHGPMILSAQSTEITNKKEGHEFKIYKVMPTSVQGSSSLYGGDSRRVMIIVTEHTAFPKVVGVVVRHRDSEGKVLWEEMVIAPEKLNVIKKAVVECEMPPFPQTLSDPVNIEICLKDMKTNKETEPAFLQYTPDDHDYGTRGKGKKRKLNNHPPPTWSEESHSRATKRTIKSVRRDLDLTTNDSFSDISSSSGENSLNELQSHQPQAGIVSLSQQNSTQSHLGGTSQATVHGELPFSSYAMLPQVKDERFANSCGVSSQASHTSAGSIVSASSSQQGNSSSVQYVFPGNDAIGVRNFTSGTESYGGITTSMLVTSSQSIFTTTQATTTVGNPGTSSISEPSTIYGNQSEKQQIQETHKQLQQMQPQELLTQMLLQAQQQILQQQQLKQPQEQQQQQQPQQQQTETASQNLLSSFSWLEELIKNPAQVPQAPSQSLPNNVPLQLPELKPNQQLALISGQFVIINDDTVSEQSNPSVQDIGGQSVVVQHTGSQPQQPVSDVQQNEMSESATGSSQSYSIARNPQSWQATGSQNSSQQLLNIPNMASTSSAAHSINTSGSAGNLNIPLTVTEQVQQYGAASYSGSVHQQQWQQSQQSGLNHLQQQQQQQLLNQGVHGSTQQRRLAANLDLDDDVEIDSVGETFARDGVGVNNKVEVDKSARNQAVPNTDVQVQHAVSTKNSQDGQNKSKTGKIVVVRNDENGNGTFEWHNLESVDFNIEVGSEVIVVEGDEGEEMDLSEVTVDKDQLVGSDGQGFAKRK